MDFIIRASSFKSKDAVRHNNTLGCRITPVGVCFMVAGAVVDVDDVSSTFQGLGLFMATVLVALAVHMILQMVVYTIASFRNPFRLMLIGFRVFFLAFITTSP